MKGIILINGYCELSAMRNQADRLLQEFLKLGADVNVVLNRFNFHIDSDAQIKTQFSGVDFCVFLDKDKYIGQVLEKLGIKTFNKISSIISCDDKMQTLLDIAGSGIKVPKTINSPLNYVGKPLTDKDFNYVADTLGFPLVMKLSYSSLGKGVFLIENMQELVEASNKRLLEPKIYQEYVKSSFGKDVRIITVGKKFLCAYMRKSSGDFRSNVALGGSGEMFTPPKEFIQMAEKVARILDLDYMGADVMFGKEGEPILCEVNSNAFIDMAESITGVNIAGAYAKHVLNVMSRKKHKNL